MKLVTVAEMRAIEKEADASGLSYAQMMENAGLGLADVVDRLFGSSENQRVVVGLVGTGNNGGDTLVALAALALAGWKALACLVRDRGADALVDRLREAGGEVLNCEGDAGMQQLRDALGDADVLLDGVLGTGAKLPLKPEITAVLAAVAEYCPFLTVVAVDCPSGVDCDSGEAAKETIPADVTVCMAAVKAGLLKFPAFSLAGRIEVVGIGLEEDIPTWAAIQRRVISAPDVIEALPERGPESHKGTFGTAMVAAGSLNYTGAALLAGKAAYRAGAGLVRLAVPGAIHAALAGHLPEATWLLLPHEMGVISEDAFDVLSKNLEGVTALLVGPGLGLEDTTAGFIRRLASGKSMRAARGAIGFVTGAAAPAANEASHALPPLVMDADGLKLLARLPDWPKLLPANTILTPHPGEMSVLTGLPVAEIQADRAGTAARFAQEWGQVVILKGAVTVIAEPGGQAAFIPVATPALARAGTGDVLAGLVAGLLAQGMKPFEAAWAGAWIHAQAGVSAANLLGSEQAVLAGDVLDALTDVLARLEEMAG